MKKNIAVLLTSLSLFAAPKLVAITITPASGGTGISADTASGSWTSLGAITLAETGGNKGEITSGTIVFVAPAGFEFNTGHPPTVSFGNKDVTGATVSMTSATTFSVTLTVSGTGKVDSVAIGGAGVNALQVRPTAGTPLATAGHISSTTAIDGLTGASNLGDLSEVAGNASQLVFTSSPGTSGVGLPLNGQSVIRTVDQFGNNSTRALGASLSVGVGLSSGAGTLLGTTSKDIGTAAGNGVVTFSDLQIDVVGNDKQLTAAATGLTSALSVVFAVTNGTPVISWANPADISYGTALSTNELNATATVSGTFAYSPDFSTVLDAGNAQTLSVTFTPDDLVNYTVATKNVSINVLKLNPTVTWSTPAEIVYGTALSGTQLNAGADVAGAFTYTPNTNDIINAGTQTLSVTFVPDNANYNTTNVSVSINVLKASSTIAWSNPADITYGTGLSGAQLNATPSVAGTLVYSPSTNAVLNAGTNALSVSFTPSSANYDGTNATVFIVVNKATPVLTWNNPADITYGTALSGTQLNASANVAGGTFTYNPTSGTVLALGNGQTLSVDYTPSDTNNYNNASTTASINVLKAMPVITWNNPANITYPALLSTNELNATANVAGTFTYTPSLDAQLNAGAGQTLSVSFVPDDANNYSNATATASITVLKATPSITWNTPAGIVYGTALSGTQLNASPSVAGTLTYNPTNGTVLNAGNQTLNVSLTPDDSTNYNSVNGSVVINVAQAPVTITWNNPADINYGTALSATQLNASASVAGTYAYNQSIGTVLASGNYTLSVNFTSSSANYSNATSTVSLNVLAVPLTVQANDATRVVGQANPTFTATYSGFVNGDTAASLTTPVTFSTVADTASPIGFYDIVPSSATSGNYNISYVNGILTVAPTNAIVSTTTGGNWSASSTWVGGNVPTSADSAVIAAGSTVTVDVAANCFSLVLSNSTVAVPSLVVSATKSLTVGGGSGFVLIGQNIVPTNNTATVLLNVAGSLSCGNVNLIGRRSANNDRHHAVLRLSNAGAVVTVTNNITQDRNVTTGALQAQVDFTAAGLLKVGGRFVAVGQGGTLAAGTGTVDYYANANQAVAPFTYNNLTLSGSGTKTNSATGISATGTLTLKDTAAYAGPTPTYASGATLFYGRTGAQVTGTELPAAPPAIWNLSVSNAAGVTLSQSASVPGTLRLIAGNLNTGAKTLTANGTTVQTGGYVVGNLKKSFAIGAGVSRTFEVGSTAYNPVTITVANVSVAGSLTVVANAGDSSSIGSSILDASKSVNANWNINTDGTLAFDNYSATFNYAAADLDAGASSSLLILGDYSAGSWIYPAVAARTATSVQVNGLTGFSTFQLAENASKTVSTITWGTPSDVVYGTALDNTQLNATPSAAGSVTYSPATGTVLDAGNGQVLTASFAPADPANYTAATNTVSINVNKANLSVTADSFARFFGEANPTFTGTLSGVVNSDNITASYSCVATQGSAPGVYTILAGLNDPSSRLGNYNVSNTSGNLTINGLPMLSISGGFNLQVAGPTNVSYTIQASTDLAPGSWQTIGSTTLGGSGFQEFQDVAPTNGFKFYRIAQ